MRLGEQQLRQTEAALSGELGPELMELMRALSLRAASTFPVGPRARTLAAELGWVDAAEQLRLTVLGATIADSLREYLWWLERGRELPKMRAAASLHPDRLAGRRVLEIGCGFGCNLLSLQASGVDAFGIDREPLYLQLSPLLAGLANVPPPRVACAAAEQLPVASSSVDAVLSHSSIQYMNIPRVLAEIARVLRPDGIALVVTAHFLGYARSVLTRRGIVTAPRALARQLLILGGIAVSPWFGRALLRPGDPLHPTPARMRDLMWQSGLVLEDTAAVRVGRDVVYVAHRASS